MNDVRLFLHTLGEMIGFLAFCGLVSAFFRWRNAERKEFVVAFGLVMIGIILREYAIWKYDAITWVEAPDPLYVLTVGKAFLLSGALLYIWGTARKKKMGWIVVPLVTLFGFVVARFVI